MSIIRPPAAHSQGSDGPELREHEPILFRSIAIYSRRLLWALRANLSSGRRRYAAMTELPSTEERRRAVGVAGALGYYAADATP